MTCGHSWLTFHCLLCSGHLRLWHLFDTWEKRGCPGIDSFSPRAQYPFSRNSMLLLFLSFRASPFFHLSGQWTPGIQFHGYVFETSFLHYFIMGCSLSIFVCHCQCHWWVLNQPTTQCRPAMRTYNTMPCQCQTLKPASIQSFYMLWLHYRNKQHNLVQDIVLTMLL
jgi:hypothetical protein